MKTELTTGEPVPEDWRHTKLRPNGQQEAYIVLSAEERAKGFVKPLRYKYVHTVCGVVTKMGSALSETYARDPYFYGGTFCTGCGKHFDLSEFNWDDGEPMDPLLQSEWNATKQEREIKQKAAARDNRIAQLRSDILVKQTELDKLLNGS